MRAVFRYDFNSPYAYLAASRVDEVLGKQVEWEPIAFGFLLAAQQHKPKTNNNHNKMNSSLSSMMAVGPR